MKSEVRLCASPYQNDLSQLNFSNMEKIFDLLIAALYESINCGIIADSMPNVTISNFAISSFDSVLISFGYIWLDSILFFYIFLV